MNNQKIGWSMDLIIKDEKFPDDIMIEYLEGDPTLSATFLHYPLCFIQCTSARWDYLDASSEGRVPSDNEVNVAIKSLLSRYESIKDWFIGESLVSKKK